MVYIKKKKKKRSVQFIEGKRKPVSKTGRVHIIAKTDWTEARRARTAAVVVVCQRKIIIYNLDAPSVRPCASLPNRGTSFQKGNRGLSSAVSFVRAWKNLGSVGEKRDKATEVGLFK